MIDDICLSSGKQVLFINFWHRICNIPIYASTTWANCPVYTWQVEGGKIPAHLLAFEEQSCKLCTLHSSCFSIIVTS